MIKPVIIFGAGNRGNALLNRLFGWQKIAYFADNDKKKQGRIFRGIPIISYEEMLKKKDKFDIVLSTKITSMKQQLEKDEVRYSVFSSGINGYFNRTDVLEAMDNFYYDRWRYDKEGLAYLFYENIINWFRDDCESVNNDWLIKTMLAEDGYIENFYSYDDFWEDEKYCNRPDMRLSRRIINSSNKKMHICDLACGHGELIKKLARDGHEVLGVDCNPNRVRYLSDEGIAAKCDRLESFSTADKFDCVIMLQVLEHVKDVVLIVERLCSLLRPRGSVFVAVPLGKNCDCDEHVRQFTENRLANLFADNCWEIENILKVPYQNDQMPNNILLQARYSPVA